MPPRPSSSLSQSPTSMFFQAEIDLSTFGPASLVVPQLLLELECASWGAPSTTLLWPLHSTWRSSEEFATKATTAIHIRGLSPRIGPQSHPTSATSDSWLMSSASKVLPWGRAIGSNSTTGRCTISRSSTNDQGGEASWSSVPPQSNSATVAESASAAAPSATPLETSLPRLSSPSDQ